MKTSLFLSVLLVLLSACEKQTPEAAETEKRIAVCQEVMKTYIAQGNVYERDRKRLIGSCHISQRERSLEQWKCTLAAMEKGAKYDVASNQCGYKGAAAP